MKQKHRGLVYVALGLAAAVLTGGAANAHHSFAMFDETRAVKLSGTVLKVTWANPHVLLWVGVPDPKGKMAIWAIESPQSPANLKKFGWTRDSLKAGDKVSVSIGPLRDGRTGGSLQKVTVLSTGKVYYNGSRGPDGGPLGPDGKPRRAAGQGAQP